MHLLRSFAFLQRRGQHFERHFLGSFFPSLPHFTLHSPHFPLYQKPILESLLHAAAFIKHLLLYVFPSDPQIGLKYLLHFLQHPSGQRTPVGINEKGFVNSNFGMFLLLDYCIENERGSVGTPLCRVLINISSKSSKIVYFSQNCYFHVM